MQTDDIYKLVQTRYGELAGRTATAESREYEESVARSFGYEASELSALPHDANLGVSCGNPLAVANLREGETVIDLGSGGGIDVLLAARKVGPQGKAIGIDMTKSMLELARKNAEKAGLSNVSFVEGSITSIPLPDSTADCIISNCVVNLVPTADKHLVFREMFRLLKPGGRVAISDILTRKALPDGINQDLSLYVGCIAGASQVHEYEKYLRDAGFEKIMIVDTKRDLNLYKEMIPSEKDPTEQSSCCHSVPTSCCGTSGAGSGGGNLMKRDFNEWAGAFQIYAVKS